MSMHDRSQPVSRRRARASSAREPVRSSCPDPSTRTSALRSRRWRMNGPRQVALAAELATVLPALDLSDAGPVARLDDRSPLDDLGHRDADLHLALLVEARGLLDADEE